MSPDPRNNPVRRGKPDPDMDKLAAAGIVLCLLVLLIIVLAIP